MISRSRVKTWCVVLLMAASAMNLFAAKKKRLEFDAVVISVDDRHQEVHTHRSYTNQSTTYNGHSTASSTSNYGYTNTSVNTFGTASTNATTHHVSHTQDIVGHQLVLQMPDGRLITVECNSKYVPRGDYVNARSCRVPLVSEVRVEVWKDHAKMYWSTSVDNSKVESETYKILGVLPAPSNSSTLEPNW